MKLRVLLTIVFTVQVVSALLFLFDLAIPILGVPLILDWSLHEGIELAAATALIIGVLMGAIAMRQMRARSARVEAQLRVASGAFMELLEERFEEWGLTPAEREVAFFSIKGLSTQEIAEVRNTSEGTVKAQTNGIYRKAGVSGRPQLLSLFIEDLIAEDLVDRAQP
ncbi:LuxR C-terminal-related transcriptional regulator [Sulfitobacter sp. D35]|uniref:helix-turn-helix transcriptional regulator n=1 Tax=Sulfitobacter sp. D35 TaxID=3083252 RepID=UPI00296F06B7|nr:LuxR C-terminal-related transcriptional regulator [Sulfitobacter sp. D35]MDW4498667.1 LuxR C-terminal-related transcriptional regulator [Sulfitobacter sp. D35]